MNMKTRLRDMKKLLRSKVGNDADITTHEGGGDNNQIDVMDLFGGSEGIDRVLGLNIAVLKQNGKYKGSNMLSLFRGDLDAAVREAVEQRRVDPWIIAVCPMVSPTLWKSACETYANQLLDEPEADPMEIVTYLLACHRVEEAVNVLCEKALFREAFVLAKVRLGSDNAIVAEVLEKWAKSMVFQGNFELAAQCYISMGKYEEAASVLFRRSNIELLELAVELAKLSGNEELHKAVLFRFNAFNAAKSSQDDKKEESHKMNNQTSEKTECVCKDLKDKSEDKDDKTDCVCKIDTSAETPRDTLKKEDNLKDLNNGEESLVKDDQVGSKDEEAEPLKHNKTELNDDTNKIEAKDTHQVLNKVDSSKIVKELEEPIKDSSNGPLNKSEHDIDDEKSKSLKEEANNLQEDAEKVLELQEGLLTS